MKGNIRVTRRQVLKGSGSLVLASGIGGLLANLASGAGMKPITVSAPLLPSADT